MRKLKETDLEIVRAAEQLTANGREPDPKVRGKLRAIRQRASREEALRITRLIQGKGTR